MTIWNTKQWKERREEILLIKSACEWCGSRTRLQIAHKDKERKTGFERYSEMKDGDVMGLCASCHLAHHKGLNLCPECHGWKKEIWRQCYKCFKKENPDFESASEFLSRMAKLEEQDEDRAECASEFLHRMYLMSKDEDTLKEAKLEEQKDKGYEIWMEENGFATDDNVLTDEGVMAHNYYWKTLGSGRKVPRKYVKN